jgi:hypothetical protein
MATKTSRTLKVCCPFCLNSDATVKLDLNDLNACTCTGCDEEFSPADAAAKFQEMAERWQAVAEWVKSAPTV